MPKKSAAPKPGKKANNNPFGNFPPKGKVKKGKK